ncbi:unnamed protein product [Boreogadus saida]
MDAQRTAAAESGTQGRGRPRQLPAHMQGYQVSLPQSLMPYTASFKDDIESASAQQLRSLSLRTESAVTGPISAYANDTCLSSVSICSSYACTAYISTPDSVSIFSSYACTAYISTPDSVSICSSYACTAYISTPDCISICSSYACTAYISTPDCNSAVPRTPVTSCSCSSASVPAPRRHASAVYLSTTHMGSGALTIHTCCPPADSVSASASHPNSASLSAGASTTVPAEPSSTTGVPPPACSNNSASLSAGASSPGPVCPSAPVYTNTDAIRSPASQAASPSTKTA